MGRNLWIKQLREEDGDLILEENDPLTGPPTPGKEKKNLPPPKPDPRIINIGGKATILMGKGDRLLIETPGGGGYGNIDKQNTQLDISKTGPSFIPVASGSVGESRVLAEQV